MRNDRWMLTFDGVAVGFQMAVNLLQELLLLRIVSFQVIQASQRRSENKCDCTVTNDMRRCDPRAGLETFICDFLESHASDEEGSGLLGVAYIPVDMIVCFVRCNVCAGQMFV